MAPRKAQAQGGEQAAVEQAPENGSSEAAMPSGEEVREAVQTGQVLASRNDAAMQTFMEWCTSRADTTDEDQYAMMANVIGEIMSSGNVAELMAERSPLHARDLIDIPLILWGFEVRQGNYEESTIGHYAALQCGRAGSNETRIVTCGGMKVMAKLMMLDHFINSDETPDSYPQPIIFTSKKTAKGFHVLDIIRPEV